MHKYGVLALAQTVLGQNRRKSKSINLLHLAEKIKAKIVKAVAANKHDKF